MIILLLFQMYL